MLADDLKILKDFFGGIPPAGNQINIVIVGNTADLRQEIALLQEALRITVQELKIYEPERFGVTRENIREPEERAKPETGITQQAKKHRNVSEEVRRRRSEMKKAWWAKRKKEEGQEG